MDHWLVQHQRVVNYSALLAALVVAGRTILLAVPEPLPFMAEIGDLLYDLGLAWITAWTFQLLVIVLPAQRSRERFNALVAPRLDRLVGLGYELSDAIQEATDGKALSDFEIRGASVTELCSNKKVTDSVPGWQGDWGRIIRHLGAQAQKHRDVLKPLYGQFSPELLKALEEEELAMDQVLRLERFVRASDAKTLTRLDAPIFEWLTSLRMLYDLRRTSIAPEIETVRPRREPWVVKIPMEDLVMELEQLQMGASGP